jgi:hypothetical protein
LALRQRRGQTPIPEVFRLSKGRLAANV